MPLYMNVHRDVDASIDAVENAHELDLETRDAYDVDYRKFWVDEDSGTVSCLFEGPRKEAGNTVHEEAHDLTADEIVEVVERE